MAEQAYQQTHPAQVRSVEKANSDETDEEQIWVSRRWWTDWKRDTPKSHVKGIMQDLSPEEGDFEGDVKCPHGQLQPDSKKRTLLSDQVSKSTILLS